MSENTSKLPAKVAPPAPPKSTPSFVHNGQPVPKAPQTIVKVTTPKTK